MLEPETRTIGQTTYEAYCQSVGVKADWLEVPPTVKVAWEYAATSVIQDWLCHTDKVTVSKLLPITLGI